MSSEDSKSKPAGGSKSAGGSKPAGSGRPDPFGFLAEEIAELKRQSLYRPMRVLSSPQAAEVVVDGKQLISLSSNNYLGLATHPRLVEAALAQALDKVEAQWDPRPSVGIVLAAGGYPGDYAKGAAITGLDAAASLEGKVFHAGTALKDGQVVTAGGRVLCATALGNSVDAAQQQAYKLAAKIDWPGCFYRKDIGYRAIARERGEEQ